MTPTERDQALHAILAGQADILAHVSMVPEIVERLASVEASAKSAHHRLDTRDPVGETRCRERREACEALRAGNNTITVAQINADALLRGKWLAAVVGVVTGIAAAVGSVVTWLLGR